MKENFKRFIPHLAAIAIFVALSAVYFYPAFSGNKLRQGDITNFKGMAQEIEAFRAMYGEEPLWTNSMFGGMPAYQISVRYPSDIMRAIDRVVMLGLPSPANLFFLYLIGFYLLMIALRLKPGPAAVGAIAFALSTYFLIILEAGHNSKAHAIGYLAPILAGMIWTYRGKLALGTAVTALFVALQINANHVQITYYFGFLVGLFVLAKLIEAIRIQQVPLFAKATGLIAIAGIIGLLANANVLWNTYNYGKYTTRGETELTINPAGASNESNTTAGLDRDYVTQWSYGIGETLSLLVPNAHGGESGALIDENTQKSDPQLYNALARGYQATGIFPNTYWGDQPFTSGPVYIGAVVCLLFLLGAFFVNGAVKWALLLAALLTIALAWGKNLMGLTNFFLDYVPGYNKFRAVTIILAITELIFPLLGFIFLKKVLENPSLILDQKKKFLAAGASLVALLLLFAVAPTLFFDFLSSPESAALNNAMAGDGAPAALAYGEQLQEIRASLFRSDALRSLALVIAGIAALWFMAKGKLKGLAFVGVLAALVLVDLWPINKRYLNNEKIKGRFVQWQPEEATKSAFDATPADLNILQRETARNPEAADAIKKAVADVQAVAKQDRTGKPTKSELDDARFAALRFHSNYRVLPLSGTFQDSRAAYFHKSIGGYHGAKLKRIQELYDFHIAPEMQSLVGALQDNPTQEKINSVLRNAGVLNMLNAKYIIYNQDAPPIENPFSLGSAWFVQNLKTVANADEEIMELGRIDTQTEAVVDARFSDQVSGFSYQESADAAIAVQEHLPNFIKYIYDSPVPQAVVFSEIYYNNGWVAFLDGAPVDYFRVDYLLRGLVVPAGSHSIEFKFEPQSFALANTVTTAASVLVLLLLIGGLWLNAKKDGQEDEKRPEMDLV